MTLSRRSFTFASLVAALTPAAARANPVAQGSSADLQRLVAADASGAPDLKVKGSLAVGGSAVVLTLHVTNQGEDTDLLVARGSRPAGELSMFANVAGVRTELAAVVGPVDRREMMSRMGPIPRYQAMKRYETLTLGPYRFQLDEGVQPPAELVGTLWAASGPVEVKLAGLTWGQDRTGA